MSDQLSRILWVEPKVKPAPPEMRVEEALQKALDNTTPERPGVPWEEAEVEERSEGGYIVQQGDDA